MSATSTENLGLVGGVLILLGAATVDRPRLAAPQRQRHRTPAILETFRIRVHAWWVLCSILAAAFFIGQRPRSCCSA